jgi:hypothetical protein
VTKEKPERETRKRNPKEKPESETRKRNPKAKPTMADSVHHVDINTTKVKQITFNMIERRAFKNDGIIFGGAVRDGIISEHYSKKYRNYAQGDKHLLHNKQFWDTSVHPESAARTLVPDDMDIYFSCKQDSEFFIESLHSMCEEEHVRISTKTSKDDISNRLSKYSRMLDVQQLTLTMKAGNIPFVFSGYNIEINIDVVTPTYPIMMQPPFRNLDFLCNGFLRTKHGVFYSENTGTYIDKLTEIEKTAEVLKIQQDMIQFKTNICKFENIKQKDISTFHRNKCAFKRIHKLLKKETFEWTICNLPFELRKATEEHLESVCFVCQSQFVEQDILAIVSTTKNGEKIPCSTTHKNCLMRYLEHQYEDACNITSINYVHEDDKFIYKCPIRTPIDFTTCPCEYVNKT